MRRMWTYMALGLGVSLSTTAYIRELRQRLDWLESAQPRDAAALRKELAKVNGALSASIEELSKLHRASDRVADIDRRMGEIEQEVARAGKQLSEQHAAVEDFERMKDDIAPSALDRRMETFRRGADERWQHTDQDLRAAVKLAESTKLDVDRAREELDHIEKHVDRDKDRMWRELVGPTVQLVGDDTVGSGVLLESEPIAGTNDYRTYVLTAWHVVRDIQNGADNAHKPVPVTIYGSDGKLSPETADLVKYDATIDGALLSLNTTRRIECGAKLAPRSRLDQVKIFEQIYAVGCPLGNDPIPTFGEIADTHHVVDGGHYWMISAPTYIGNSGGGIFDAETHELLGIFSKIYTHGSLRPTVVPHMGLVTSLKTMYDWLDSAGYAKLIPAEDSAEVRAQTASAKR